MKKLSQNISLAHMGNLVYSTQRIVGSAITPIKKGGETERLCDGNLFLGGG